MKQIEIINAVNTLAGVKINKIKNDKIKFSLIADYRALRKASRSIDESRQDVIKKFQEDFAEELEAVQKLRSEGKAVTGHDAFLKAERDVKKVLDQMAQEDCPVEGLTQVSLSDFVKNVSDADLSMEDIANLDGIVIE